MVGTPEGGRKAAATNKAKYGNTFYSNIGRKGGAAGKGLKGFAANPALASVAGAIGGRRSQRTRNVQLDEPLTRSEAVLLIDVCRNVMLDADGKINGGAAIYINDYAMSNRDWSELFVSLPGKKQDWVKEKIREKLQEREAECREALVDPNKRGGETLAEWRSTFSDVRVLMKAFKMRFGVK